MKELIEGLNLPKQVLDKTENFLSTLFGPSAKEIGELFADKIRFKRLKNQIDIINKTMNILELYKLTPKQLNLKTLIPLIESSSLEEDECLQNKWANLIANISSNPETGFEPKLVKTLSNLSSIEAQILDLCYEYYLLEKVSVFERNKKYSLFKYESIDEVKLNMVAISRQRINTKHNLTEDFFEICIDNLESLGLIKFKEPEIDIDNGYPTGKLQNDEETGYRSVELDIDITAIYNQSEDFYLTTYGNYFTQQCRMK